MAMTTIDVRFRQRPLKPLNSSFGHQGLTEVQPSKFRQTSETFQRPVRHPSALKIQPFGLRQATEVLHSGVRHLGITEVESLEVSQPLQARQPRVGQSALLEVQPLELRQPHEIYHSGISHLCALEAQSSQLCQSATQFVGSGSRYQVTAAPLLSPPTNSPLTARRIPQ
jgi:hypothetical protein